MWQKCKKIILFLLWTVAVIAIQGKKIDKSNENDQPRLTICDVGQGDAILISEKEQQVLIDGGPDAKILKCLAEEMPETDLEIELVVLTHPDLDHFGGLREVFKKYKVKKLMINNLGKNSPEFMELYELIWQKIKIKEIEIVEPELAQKWCMTANLCFEILWSSQKTLPENIFSYKYESSYLSDMFTKFDQNNYDYNDGSIAIILKLVNKKFLLTGDMGETTELAMIDRGLLSKIDGLKIAHHGSKNSSSRKFLSIVRPEISLISVGKNNSFGHPTTIVLERLKEIKSEIFRTDKNGKITIKVENSKLVTITELDES